MTGSGKVSTLTEAVAGIEEGSLVAVGGHALRRHPMALLREIARQERGSLHIVGVGNGIDFDFLVACGLVRVAESAFASISGSGLDGNLSRAGERGDVEIRYYPETVARAMFRAGAEGVTFTTVPGPQARPLSPGNPRTRLVVSPFDGSEVAVVEALQADIALLHFQMADQHGNVLVDRGQLDGALADGSIGRSAKHVIVSVEQVVSDEFVLHNRELIVLPARHVDVVVEAPFGAHPCACDGRYVSDKRSLEAYRVASSDDATLRSFLGSWVQVAEGDYLDRLGWRRLASLSSPLSAELCLGDCG